jgi:hypothetical protein
MSAQASASNSGASATWSPLSRRFFLEPAALISAALSFFLALPEVTHASNEGQEVESSANSGEGERPAWLRPLGEEANSPAKPGGEPGEANVGGLRVGWSKLEPGVLDVQAWDWLQQDLARMLRETETHTSIPRSPKAFEAKFLGATVEFLEIDAEETEAFQTAVNKALNEIGGARTDILRRTAAVAPDFDETDAMLNSRAGWEEYGKAQRHALRHPLAVLQERPRHQLLREEMLKWLLNLHYGTRAVAQ